MLGGVRGGGGKGNTRQEGGLPQTQKRFLSLGRVPKSVVLETQRPLPQRLTVTIPERIDHRVTSSSKDLLSCKVHSSERTEAPRPLHYPGSRE